MKGALPRLFFLLLPLMLQQDPQLGQGAAARPLIIIPQTLPCGLLQCSCFPNGLVLFCLINLDVLLRALWSSKGRVLPVPHRISSCLAGSASHLSR